MTDDDNESAAAADSNVFPLQAHGVLDSEVLDLSNNEVLAHTLANTSASTEEAYAVKYGSGFVNKYPRRDAAGERTSGDSENPNHLLGAFPCLFPYGMGGFEVNRPCSISYEDQAKWAMRYGDKRFRKDLYFMFQVFGVIQNAKQLTVEDLVVASKEESNRQPHSNPVVRSLKHHINANPPSLWITINPSDTHNPIAQVLVGEELNLDMFDADSGPDACHRALNIATDPYAAAQFFHYIIRAILEALFGITIRSKGKSLANKVFLVFWKVTSAQSRLKAKAPFTYT
ncbi:hypothetical protein DFJ58DRAFT_737629 [Suillus subalutaceus]|uniref:uncharacterized protein n=1 Tax=Suillus subalutaceus TaxID=48586 RepID=UPI001B86F851|nr:uncharacterized protein DFJ58DRAFT_737629 [Suillus subalutaceus]KAG1828766.1 hypothetical protein DFJ58DRAFT_737629 [Suillus subalutaceus]